MESSNDDILQQKSKIFGKDSQTNVTPYQAAVNEASFCLAKANPILVSDKGHLMNLAQQKVREDGQFKFKKGKSRSKSIVQPSDVKPQFRI